MMDNPFDQFDGPPTFQVKPPDPKLPGELTNQSLTNQRLPVQTFGDVIANRKNVATLPADITSAQANSKKAVADATAAQMKIQADRQKMADAQNQQLMAKTSKVMNSDTVLKAIGEAKNDTGMLSTGLAHSIFRHIPTTNAYNLDRALQTVEGNIAFDQYSKLKEDLPPGAQGGVRLTDNELKLLKTLQGNLDPGQGQAILSDHLNSIDQQYRKNAAVAAGLDPNNPNVQKRLGIQPANPKSMTAKILGGPTSRVAPPQAPPLNGHLRKGADGVLEWHP